MAQGIILYRKLREDATKRESVIYHFASVTTCSRCFLKKYCSNYHGIECMSAYSCAAAIDHMVNKGITTISTLEGRSKI